MTLDERISFASKLIAQREEIDQQLNALFGGIAILKNSRVAHIADRRVITRRPVLTGLNQEIIRPRRMRERP